MKYAWIDAQRREYPLPDMCEVLAVSISGHRAWLARNFAPAAPNRVWTGDITYVQTGEGLAVPGHRAGPVQPRDRGLAEYGMTASMSRKGNCRDNAPSESFFNSLKNERVHGTTYATRADAQVDLFEYIEVFCNRSRRHSTPGYSSPVQFLADWISKHVDQQSKAA